MESELGHLWKGFGWLHKTKDNMLPNAGTHWRPSQMTIQELLISKDQNESSQAQLVEIHSNISWGWFLIILLWSQERGPTHVLMEIDYPLQGVCRRASVSKRQSGSSHSGLEMPCPSCSAKANLIRCEAFDVWKN